MALKDIDLKNLKFSDLKMPKLKVSSRVISIIIVIISALTFYWLYSSKIPQIRSEVEKIENENIPLAQTEQNLKKMFNEMTLYIDETKRLNKEYQNALDQFPAYMYLEDKINFVNNLRNGDFRNFGSLEELTYGESSYVAAEGESATPPSATTSENGSTESGEPTSLELYSVPISGKFINMSYENLKRFMTYGLTSNTRFVLDNISIHQSDDDTSGLSCEFTFKTFFLSGQEKPYSFSGSTNTVEDKSYLENPVKNPFGLQ